MMIDECSQLQGAKEMVLYCACYTLGTAHADHVALFQQRWLIRFVATTNTYHLDDLHVHFGLQTRSWGQPVAAS